MNTKQKEIVFPERISKVGTVSNVITYQVRGDTMYGVDVVLENGDAFTHWAADKARLEFFKPGTSLIYRLKKIITDEGTDNEKVKTRLDTFEFIMPRKTRAEVHVVDSINLSISNAVQYAKDVLVASPKAYTDKDGKINMEEFNRLLSTLADAFHSQAKSMIIAENYGEAEC